MKKLNLNLMFSSLIAILMLVSSCENSELKSEYDDVSKKALAIAEMQANCDGPVDLVAGRDKTVVGSVDVSISGNEISVTYETLGNWVITETHIQVFLDNDEWTDVPLTKKGSPKIGNFDFKMEHNYVSTYTETFESPVALNEFVYVAAHAVVTNGNNYSVLPSQLPELVSFKVNYPGTSFGLPSYFDVHILEGTYLEGSYDGWCVQAYNPISPQKELTAYLYNSYDIALPEGIVDFPENLDLVNWILNQDFTNVISPCTDLKYTWGDIQYAIWSLIDDEIGGGLGVYNECSANEIIDAARDLGEKYEPACGEKIGLILIPTNGMQKIIFMVNQDCGGESETAWGRGVEFPGADWSMYFMSCF